jgi:5-methylthioadenosine/S-adenosylhomocysteine deaminase
VVPLVSADWVLPVEGPPIERGAVSIEEGWIAAVGSMDDLGRGRHYPDCAIVPGFVNAHTHLEYAVYAGFADGLAFGEWLATHIERKRRLDWADSVDIARLGAAECLASGATTIADASFTGAAAVAASELGLRGRVYLELFGRDPGPALERFEDLRLRVEHALCPRIELGVSPHAPYSASPAVYRAAFELGLPTLTHLAESDDEADYLLRGEGPLEALSALDPPGTTSVRHLAEQGLLRDGLTAVHCVKTDADEIALLARHDVAVVHCPRSNAVLGCGSAPLTELRKAGIRVGLGTDSPASTPSFDMFEEMRAAIYQARAREARPDALTASDALQLATLGGARALGLESEVGALAAGKRADLTVVSLAGSPYLPWEDPAVAVVFGGSPDRVQLSLVDGEARYEKGGLGWLELRPAAARARARLLGKAPPEPARAPVAQKT